MQVAGLLWISVRSHFTVTVQLADAPVSVWAVMRAVPFVIPVTNPSWVTDAAFALLLHMTEEVAPSGRR